MKPAAFPQPRPHGLAGSFAGSGIALRGACEADLPFLRSLYASTREEELRAVPWPAATKTAFLEQQFALQHHHYLTYHPDAHYLVLEAGGVPIGRLYLARAAEGADRGECDLVIDICLLPSWRGRGWGGALLRAVQEGAAARSRGVELQVLRHNAAARRLYERLGFAVGEESGAHLALRWTPGRD